MKRILQHSLLLIMLLTGALATNAQLKRYVQVNSIHALSVPENIDYKFDWTINNDLGGVVNVATKSNVTQDITWDQLTIYHVAVRPILDSVNCYGEPVYMDVVVLEYLSLHAFDDVYYTTVNFPVNGNVGDNDVDESGANIIYNGNLIFDPGNGEVTLNADGSFIYIPQTGFIGIDSFMYEAQNDNTYPMFDNAVVYIIVQNETQSANLYMEKTGPENALLGENITYRIVVRNNGDDVAFGVTLKDTLAFGLFNAQYILDGETSLWNGELALGDINAGDSVVVYINADISLHSPEWIYNQALTYSEYTYDPDYSDNDSIWITHVTPLYVNLPDTIVVPGCSFALLPGDQSDGVYPIVQYEWSPSTGLNNTDISNPTFTPNNTTIGSTTLYTLTVTDSEGNVAQDSVYIVVSELPLAIIIGDTIYKDLGQIVPINGSGSIGESLQYSWWTDDGHIVSDTTLNIIQVDTVGIYHLQIIDNLSCSSEDKSVVILKSHPPVAINDTVAIEAGTDSTINVLDNDYDINNFKLIVNNIVTPPNFSTVLYWDSLGNFTIQPNADYWKIDSLEYSVCNNGNPVQCDTAWVIIKCLRPPLNADVVMQKTGDRIAFFGDSIYYDLLITSNGPDTATVLTITDRIDDDLKYPDYSLDEGGHWSSWTGEYIYRDSLRPGEDSIHIIIRAAVRLTANDTISNRARVWSEFIENYPPDNIDSCSTKIKIGVVADAGEDVILGSCQASVSLTGEASTGENLTYRWVPSTNLTNPNSMTPIFNNPGISGDFSLRLTVTDDDNISDTAIVIVTVLPPPVADAGPDAEIEVGDTIGLVGSNSQGSIESYFWETNNGHILFGTEVARTVVIDTVGLYTLTVTDVTGCTASDDVNVYWFYYPPFAIPDYYSIQPTEPLVGNVRANDYDPNTDENFVLTVDPGNYTSENGGSINMADDGSFTYIHLPGFTGVDNFTYTICNDAIPARCSTGSVYITVNPNDPRANLAITKEAVNPEVIIGDSLGTRFKLTIVNKGPDVASNVELTDTLSKYLADPYYSLNGSSSWLPWDGTLPLGSLAKDEQLIIYLRATVTDDAPGLIFNAATVTSEVFDDYFDWMDVPNRNVDTASVRVVSDLFALAQLVEQFDSDWNDHIIGACDDVSYLSASNSQAIAGIDGYEWTPNNLLNSFDSETSTFTHLVNDTTVQFILTVNSGRHYASSTVEVTFSPEPFADAGPDRKINPGVPLVLDATKSYGANASYDWTAIEGTPISTYFANDPLQPNVETAGIYALLVTDMHGCQAGDTVTIRQNDLFVVNDIMIVVEGDTVIGNVSTNDYDPDGDSIYFSNRATKPIHGTLIDFPGNTKSAPLDSNKIADDGTFIYVPTKGYVGRDYFLYEVCDNNDPDLCKLGTVYIQVIDVDSVNSLPVANSDYLFVNKGDTIVDNLLLNDYDFDGGIIELTDITVYPTKGSITFDPDGTIIYVPYDGVDGIDEFVYLICDNGNPVACDTARVTIQIHKLSDDNHKPVAVDDAYFVVEKTIHGNILANDYDPDDDVIEMEIVPQTGPLHGVFRIEPDGSFVYTPDLGFEGTDQVIYSICEVYTDERYCSYATLLITSLAEKRYTTDVSIKKIGPVDILSGSTIEYEIRTTIEGPTLANDIVMLDTLFNELTNVQYSTDGGIIWNKWNLKDSLEQLFLYQDSALLIRADIPDLYEGPLYNRAYVEHDMNELDSSNNVSEVVTHVYQKVIANAGIDTTIGACFEEFILDGTASIGMTDDLEYHWFPPELLKNPNTANPVYTTEPGTSTEFMLVVDNSVSTYTDSDTAYVTLHVDVAPEAYAGEDFEPDSTEMVVLNGSSSTGIGPLEYLWWMYDDNNNVVEIGNSDTVSVRRSGSYYLTVTDIYGCKNTDRVNVIYPIDPFIAVDDYIETWQQTPVDIFVLRNDIIDEEDDYNLSLLVVKEFPVHGELIQRQYDSLFTYIPEMYYHGMDTFAYLATTNTSFDDAIVVIKVKEKPPVIPDGFSPNGDGINDFFIIENIDLYEQNSIVVFNRWGNIVYEKEKYSNDEPWDGVANRGIRIGNGALPTGVYFYIVDLGPNEMISQRKLNGYIYIASDNRR